MKTSQDPRHKRRQNAVKILYTQSFIKKPTRNKTVNNIINNLNEVDKIITKIAPEFPLEKINKVDLAILRLSVFELTVEKKAPTKVVIDEAIELAKEYGGESSPGFINGALGNLLKDDNINK